MFLRTYQSIFHSLRISLYLPWEIHSQYTRENRHDNDVSIKYERGALFKVKNRKGEDGCSVFRYFDMPARKAICFVLMALCLCFGLEN